LEILAAVAIVAILAAISFATFFRTEDRAKEKATANKITAMSSALEAYLADDNPLPPGNGDASSSTALYEALSGDTDHDGEPDAGKTVYDSNLSPSINAGTIKCPVELIAGKYVIIDSFGNPMRYRTTGGKNTSVEDGYDIWGMGKDGQTDASDDEADVSKDDITNWRG